MKKFGLILPVAAAAVMSSCGGGSIPKADLKEPVDTLCYAIGMQYSNGLKEHFTEATGLDSIYIDEWLKGLASAVASTDKKEEAYAAGMAAGMQIKNQIGKGLTQELYGNDSTKTIPLANVVAGFASTINGNSALDAEKLQEMIPTLINSIKSVEMEKKYGDYKKENEAFMAKIAKKAGVKKLKDGIYYEVVTEGNGEKPSEDATVKINYEGKTIDGKVFDTTKEDDKEEPRSLNLRQVIPGWRTAVSSMPVGSKWIVYIPQDQGYGPQEMGDIKPFSALTFTIELIEVSKEDNAPMGMPIQVQ